MSTVTFSGLGNSNFDAEELITKLKTVEQTKANQLFNWKSDWETRLAAFQQLRTEILSLQTTLQNMNTVEKFLVKNAGSSNTGVVSATTGSEASEGVYSIEVNQLATNSVWSIDTGLSSKSSVINGTGMDGSFRYTYKGKSYTVNVPNGTNLEGLKNIINNASSNPGVKAQLIESSDGIVFQLRGLDTGQAASLNVDSVSNVDCLALEKEALWTGAGTNSLTSSAYYSSSSSVLNSTQTSKSFVFSVDGTATTVKLKAGGTLEDLRDAVNATTTDSGVTASIVSDTVDGQTVYRLQLDGADPAGQLSVDGGTLAGFGSMEKAANWQTQAGQNAEIRVNGWPQGTWLERSTNAVDDIADGVTFNLRSEGSSTVTVELDTAAMEANIEAFVAGINSLRVTLQSLTAVDTEKTVYEPEYADNQLEMQQGSTLTGNYGVQLLASNLKTLIAGKAEGFNYLTTKNGVTSGDIFSSLSQIGITTCADQASTNYGLLVINEIEGEYGSLTLTQALQKDPVGVAKLFAANSEGVSNSSYFGHNSHIAKITKAGTYDVSYTTDADGNISEAYINGKKAKIEDNGRQVGIYSSEGAANDADGLLLDIYDFTPGKTFTGTVSIRNGKVNELLNTMDGAEGLLGEDGALRILEKNYQTIIDNIEDKIQKEDERLTRWEKNIRLRFARLDEVLSNYSSIQSTLESQIEQMKSST